MERIAQLPMYDFPQLRAATDALWSALAERLRGAGIRDVPERLTRALSHDEGWREPHLLLSQSCGYPAMTRYRDSLRIVASPVYAAPGCSGATHRSFIVVPRGSPARSLADLRGGRFAMNGRDSNTGMNLPRHSLAPLAQGARFFSAVIESGSHAESMALVADGAADAAAIDCVTFALIERCRSDLASRIRVLATTAASPALPFVTARSTDEATVSVLRRALAALMVDPTLAEIRAALLIDGMVEADAADYAPVLALEAEARALGYAELR